MTPDVLDAVLRRITGRTPAAWTPVHEGAYSPAARWVVRWAEGGSAFVKAEEHEWPDYGVAVERAVYAALDLAFLPRLYAYDDGPPRVLVTEDLSHARWGTPVTADDAAALRAVCDALAAVPAPPGVVPIEVNARWAGLAADPARLVASGLMGEEWAAAHLPALVEAEARADVTGDRLVHGDVWLQNWCRTERGLVVVDWAGARVADPHVMAAGAEAAVRAAGGPPGVVLSGRPEWAAWMAGQAAFWLVDLRPGLPDRLAETLRREAVATLAWACAELGLPVPEPAGACAGLGPWRP